MLDIHTWSRKGSSNEVTTCFFLGSKKTNEFQRLLKEGFLPTPSILNIGGLNN
jgi:hypothetical protein